MDKITQVLWAKETETKPTIIRCVPHSPIAKLQLQESEDRPCLRLHPPGMLFSPWWHKVGFLAESHSASGKIQTEEDSLVGGHNLEIRLTLSFLLMQMQLCDQLKPWTCEKVCITLKNLRSC